MADSAVNRQSFESHPLPVVNNNCYSGSTGNKQEWHLMDYVNIVVIFLWTIRKYKGGIVCYLHEEL